MLKHKSWFWVAALAAACFFDYLFWKKPFGISFFIWTAALLGFGYLLAWREGKRPALASILISLLTLGFSFVPAWRVEGMTRFVSVMLTLGGLLLLSATFTNGNWPFYHMWNYFKNLFIAIGAGLSRVFTMNARNSTPPALDETAKKPAGKKVWAVFRGLLIGLPIVTLFAVLLSSADPVFGDWLKQILNIEKLPEYLFRLFYIVLIGCFILGIYLHAIHPTKVDERPDPQQPWMKPFLGWTETAVILGAVDLLFLTFVFIQVRYLFGGTANISETGFSYADYARRGFAELVAVAVISLGLYLCLNTVTKRENKAAKVGFSSLTVLLMLNVLVILSSSLMRMLLYENAYGFSQLRTYTHVFILWLAGLIMITILLELFRRRGRFALALLVTVLGFGASLAVINVDQFVAQKNIERSLAGEELDASYLTSLSADAVPYMINTFTDPATTANVKDALGYSLACHQAVMEDPASKSWQGFNLANTQAWQFLQENKSAWSEYKLLKDEYGNQHYLKDGLDVYCWGSGFMD